MRKVCSILDNCSALIDILALKAIKMVFLPPNTTVKFQSWKQGIIRCLKSHYRKEVIQKAIECYDVNKEFKINLLESLTIVRKA